MLAQRKRVNAAFRHFYHVGLGDVDLAEAADLFDEFLPVQKLMAGIDPDFVDPAEWFARANARPADKDVKTRDGR